MFISKKRITAADEVEVNEAPVEVAEEASDLLFEAKDGPYQPLSPDDIMEV